MATCEVCENEYDKAFEVIVAGKHHTFDSFECAIHALAPVCPHCHCRVVGHGVEQEGKIFCCVHCARSGGKTDLERPRLSGARYERRFSRCYGWCGPDYFRCQASVTFLIRSLQVSLTNVNVRLFSLVRRNLYAPGPLQPFAVLPPVSWILTVSPATV